MKGWIHIQRLKTFGKWLHNCNQISEIKKVKAITEKKSVNARYLMTAKFGVCSLGSWRIFAHRNEIAEYAKGRNYKESSHNGYFCCRVNVRNPEGKVSRHYCSIQSERLFFTNNHSCHLQIDIHARRHYNTIKVTFVYFC